MIAEVIVDILNSNVDKVFDYKIPDELDVQVGCRVLVPFGNKTIEGYVINIKESSEFDNSKLKGISKNIDAQPILNKHLVSLCFFMKEKFYLRLADTIRLFLPPQVRNHSVKPKTVNIVKLANDDISLISARAKSQIKAFLYLKEKAEVSQTELNKMFGAGAIKGLIDLGLASVSVESVLRTPQSKFNVAKKEITLTDGQAKAIEAINKSKYQTFLLHGVTGSGKTEVYINCIQKVIKEGKSAIMLVPEISLTPQMFARFRNAFGDTVAILHSSLSSGERYDEWMRLKNGEAKIAIGARSCIFAPLSNVGLIVVDEEHDTSYFSESNPRYYTHTVARYLAYLHNCPLVLGSATPSIDSYNNAKEGVYRLLELPNRANNKDLPQIQIVDMLSEIRNGNDGIFSSVFLQQLEECVANKKQAMLFINRRGFSSFLMCRECGFVPKCESCDVSLVYHKDDNMLKCHYCNKRYKVLHTCPKCGSNSIRFGAVGTQRVVDEIQKLFPEVPVLRLDNDSTQNKDSYIEILEKFNHTTPSILVGTQMIAKGHDFNNVTLVGIIDADLSLFFSDFRAPERTFQLITQVSGRAGRSEYEGKVVLQTYFPRHYIYRCASNYDYGTFFKKEISLRKVAHFPPYTNILRILVSGENDTKVFDTTKEINKNISTLKEEYSSDFVFCNAMKCPKKRIQNKYRYQILMRFYSKNADEIISKIYNICDIVKKKDVSVFVENNPQNLS